VGGGADAAPRRAARGTHERDSKRIHLRCALIGSRFLRASGPHIRHVCPRHSGLSVLPVPAAVTRKQGDALCGPVAEQIARPNLRGFFPVQPPPRLSLAAIGRSISPR